MFFRSPQPATLIREAFWIVLGRAASEDEVRAKLTDFDGGGITAVVAQLLSSPEFHLIFCGWTDDIGIGKDPVTHESGLRSLGPDESFVARAYEWILGRPADADGLAHYARALAAGEARREVVRVLVVSDEFAERYRSFSAQKGGYLPRDVQLCELANPAKWDNPDWLRLLRELKVLPHHKLAMHRKSYEFAQLLFGLTRLGRLNESASVLSVGAGHECGPLLVGQSRRPGRRDRLIRRALAVRGRPRRRRSRGRQSGGVRAISVPDLPAVVHAHGRPGPRVSRS